ncbi:hypothetical protein BDA96_05G030400 [Sorghum bicolor]|uniref:Uncharacterized protein n=2 Tax=Sorghum bicolor TaxID=4558 RepID=A0A1Z5RGM7_SORBI|nr:hypothetical protein BDA96_05G030400 [Sorghum bicolor]OQU82843.1 hypothetical protein SORBI_3005G029300 [Sorghum bicolor]OQU82844.1 hypothetical protein SORBI_3005G029300 [Sorghum bicolor]OQU82846.1 hypothetical protein SORBI_3005G029300 [Sorghum bicolor]OQU82847.1 hypothetical protein SORBI_3005G029300 [Sorghum bicolor]
MCERPQEEQSSRPIYGTASDLPQLLQLHGQRAHNGKGDMTRLVQMQIDSLSACHQRDGKAGFCMT